MPTQVGPKLLSWASDVEGATLEQAAKASRLPFVVGHVALMPDAHVGIGSTVGSVIPTDGAIIPAAIGVDIGCGMIATETDLVAGDSTDEICRAVIHTVRTWDIPIEHFEAFLQSMQMDLTTSEYANFDDLEKYVLGSAAAIGLQVLPVLEPISDAAALFRLSRRPRHPHGRLWL